jgi:uncharacterized protein involved in exopolysaccharide biosynthesis/Mrp family chromosome partitioning ATPase
MSFEKPRPGTLLAGRYDLPQRPDDPGVDLKELMAILARRRRCLLVMSLAVVLPVLYYLLSATPIYTASAQILVEPRAQRTIDNQAGADSYPPDGGMAFVESQLRIVESEGVLRRVVAAEELTSDPEFVTPTKSSLPEPISRLLLALGLLSSEMETHELRALRHLKRVVSTKHSGKALVIEVLASSHDRQKSASIANAVAEAYLAEQVNARAEGAGRAAASLRARLADLRETVRQAEEDVQNYKFQHNTVGVPSDFLPLATSEALVGLRELERNLEVNRAIYQSSLMRARQIAEEGALDWTVGRIISRAVPPISRSWPPSGLLLGVALAAGLGLGTGLAVMRDYFDGRINTQRQLTGSCPYPIIAVIPPITAAASVSRLLTDLTHGASRQTKSEGGFLKLRDALSATEDGRTSTTLLITSSGAGDGKSTIAVNLALASMRDGERVLLIDADFRNCTISRQLAGQASQAGQQRPGLGDILKGLSTFDASITFLAEAKLAVLAAGSTEGVRARVDRAWLVEKIFSKCREFDLVIVDCGDATTDRFVRSLAAVVETIIIVVRAGRTRLEDLEPTVTALRDVSARIQGIVFNEARG